MTALPWHRPGQPLSPGSLPQSAPFIKCHDLESYNCGPCTPPPLPLSKFFLSTSPGELLDEKTLTVVHRFRRAGGDVLSFPVYKPLPVFQTHKSENVD